MSFPDFSEFYEALHGNAPFPWQSRLARSISSGEPWPGEIGVPTGMGKTACLDIAVWWLASQADLSAQERTAPTRIWWLVNRRLLIDATADHASRLAEALDSADSALPIRAVGERLQSLSTDGSAPSLQVIRLRGGVAAQRPLDPAQPAVVLTTLPMYGSRLLFRGYGSSRSMRPVDAALAGTDSLLLVDEAHLVQPLLDLFGPLAECDRVDRSLLPPTRSRALVVSLTATGAADGAERFDLDDDDRRHEVVARRLAAAKPTEVREQPARTDPASHLADAARDLLDARGQPASCVVFVNTPALAARTARLLEGPDTEVVVLTGQMREREAAEARARLLDETTGVRAGATAASRERSLVVVATQTLEVGADVDFELCVTEACGVRALTQRLGRLNRLGNFGHARATYVHVEPKARGAAEPEWRVYGSEPLAVLERLRSAARDGVVDLAPAKVADALGPPGDAPGRSPEVLPAHLSEWVKTTTPPPGEAPVEPFFSGLAGPERRLSVCWRAYVPPRDDPPYVLWPRVTDAEVVEVAVGELVDSVGVDAEVVRLAGDRVTVEHVAASSLRAGDLVVLPSDAGRYGPSGWDPEAEAVVADMSLAGHGLPLDAEAFARLVAAPPLAALRAVLAADEPDEAPELLEALREELRSAEPIALTEHEWLDLLVSLDLGVGVVEPSGRPPSTARSGAPVREGRRWLGTPAGRHHSGPRLVVTAQPEPRRADELDELSAGAQAEVGLAGHGRSVGERAEAVAASIGLPAAVRATVGLAARFHDEGKADRRFQRWLDPNGLAQELVAKSTASTNRWEADRVAAGWPRGGRHEELSARLVRAWLALDPPLDPSIDRELLVHLVVSHHGRARPLLLPVEDRTGDKVEAVLDGAAVTADADLSLVDWEQPDRFAALNRRYGAWGLALLEAVVRQADHVVSARGWRTPDQEVV